MTYTRVNYTDIDPVSGAVHSLGDPLETAELGISVVHCDPGWQNRPHNHADSDHEEVYLLLDGEAMVVVNDESIVMEPDDAIRIAPDSTRQIRNGVTESTFVLVSAPAWHPTRAESPDETQWITDSFIG